MDAPIASISVISIDSRSLDANLGASAHVVHVDAVAVPTSVIQTNLSDVPDHYSIDRISQGSNSTTDIPSQRESFGAAATSAWTAFKEGLKIAKEASDFFPPLKAATGGLVAVLNYIDDVNGVQKELENVMSRINVFVRLLQHYGTQRADLAADGVRDRFREFAKYVSFLTALRSQLTIE
ncbi:hypothetical protein EWM64_g10189 [Hericium alpestre]|uniref:Fungal STAND N-terminal Goodbye domain-containing protein n=1 Tax=Hericium alpestre TaxID=135208 RepID=A0A4Y9ZIW7_9AGAM|nr:hypothetical protein EWM64_g10189 [Hericium alpestre]